MANTFPETLAEFERTARESDRVTALAVQEMYDTVRASGRLIAESRRLMAQAESVLAEERRMWREA